MWKNLLNLCLVKRNGTPKWLAKKKSSSLKQLFLLEARPKADKINILSPFYLSRQTLFSQSPWWRVLEGLQKLSKTIACLAPIWGASKGRRKKKFCRTRREKCDVMDDSLEWEKFLFKAGDRTAIYLCQKPRENLLWVWDCRVEL